MERLIDTFTVLGVPYEVKDHKPGVVTVRIDEGNGYSDFFADFNFDENGKFQRHGVWE